RKKLQRDAAGCRSSPHLSFSVDLGHPCIGPGRGRTSLGAKDKGFRQIAPNVQFGIGAAVSVLAGAAAVIAPVVTAALVTAVVVGLVARVDAARAGVALVVLVDLAGTVVLVLVFALVVVVIFDAGRRTHGRGGFFDSGRRVAVVGVLALVVVV